MRRTVIPANPSDLDIAKVAAPARRSAPPGTGIVPVTGTFGARLIAAPPGRVA